VAVINQDWTSFELLTLKLTKVHKMGVEVPGSQSNKRGDTKNQPNNGTSFHWVMGWKHLNNGNGVQMWVRCVMLG
jgi:hypothetical protein